LIISHHYLTITELIHTLTLKLPSILNMASNAVSMFQKETIAAANPFVIGDIILDGDEDAQVIVWEDGAPTTWALQFQKWRNYFHIPDNAPVDPHNPLPEWLLTSWLKAQEDQTKKRSAEEAGLEQA